MLEFLTNTITTISLLNCLISMLTLKLLVSEVNYNG